MSQRNPYFRFLIQFLFLFAIVCILEIFIPSPFDFSAGHLVDVFSRVLNLSIVFPFYWYLQEIRHTNSVENFRVKRNKIAVFVFFFTWIATTLLQGIKAGIKHSEVNWFKLAMLGLGTAIFTIALAFILTFKGKHSLSEAKEKVTKPLE